MFLTSLSVLPGLIMKPLEDRTFNRISAALKTDSEAWWVDGDASGQSILIATRNKGWFSPNHCVMGQVRGAGGRVSGAQKKMGG
jgi:hypothetical protein